MIKGGQTQGEDLGFILPTSISCCSCFSSYTLSIGDNTYVGALCSVSRGTRSIKYSMAMDKGKIFWLQTCPLAATSC
jgi:hypothetical protein